MAAAEQLFASRGFAKTTMAHIATKAEVAVGSLYRAFPDKLALLTALHDSMEQRFIDAILRSWDIKQTAEARFRHMIEAIMEETVAVQSSMPLYMQTRDLVSSGGQEPGARTVAVIAELYEAGITRGEFIAMRPSMAAAIGHGIVEGGMRDWMMQGGQAADLQAAVDAMSSCFARAFVVMRTPQS
jgi:AcrR family transcriptional regulator